MATLTSTKIKNTYDALLKATDNDAIGSTAKQITDGLGNGTPLYISTSQIGIGVTPEATYDLHVYSNAKVGGNLTITGDLTVNGTTTTVDTDTLRVEDPLIEVARNNTSADSVDIGIYGKYAPSATTLYAGLFRDAGDDKFKLFKSLEEAPTTTVNTSGTGYAVATLVANLEGIATLADTSTAITQSQNDNSTKVATTAYVDTAIDGIDTLAEILAIGNTTGGTDISVSSGDDITFADDSKSIYGASSDLKIYHNTVDEEFSIIEAANHNLKIINTANDSNIVLQTDDGSGSITNYLIANGFSGAVELYHYGSKKFETSSTGVTVTGQLNLGDYGSGTYTGTATYRLAVDSSGDVIEIPIGDGAVDGSGTANYVTKWSDTDTITDSVIYDDGTNVGIGTTSPNALLEIDKGSEGEYLRVGGDNANNARSLRFTSSTSSSASVGALHTIKANSVGGEIAFANGNGNIMYLDVDRNVGIGTDSPSYLLHLEDSNGADLALSNSSALSNGDYLGRIYGLDNSGNFFTGINMFYHDSDDGEIRFRVKTAGSNTDVMTIVDGGVGIGTSSPDTKLHIEGNLLVDAYSVGEDNGIFLREGFLTIDQPSITVWDMTNSGASPDGLSINANDGIRFRENGGEVARFKDGNLGIGSDSPSNNLQVKTGSNGGGITIQRNSSSSGAFADLMFSITTSDAATPETKIRATRGASYDDTDISFITSNSEVMRIDSSGSVGIGTDSPNTILEIASGNSGGDAALDAPVFRINNTTESSDWDTDDVVGSIEYYTSDASGNAPYVTSFIKSVNETGNGTLPSGAMVFGTATYNASGGAVERIRITSGGYILTGGRTSVTGNWGAGSIEAERAVGAFNSNKTIYLFNNGTDIKLDAYDYGASSALDITIGGNGGDIILDANVGIGTDSPSARLNISGTGTGAAIDWSNTTATTGRNFRWVSLNAGGFAVEDLTASGANRLTIDSSGDVGINTTNPTEKLFVGSGNIGLNDAYALKWGSVYIDGVDASDILRFYTSSTERVRVDSSGVVQVRNQTPTIQLYNTDTSLGENQTLGDIDWYQSDASSAGVGVVAKIRGVNISTFSGMGELAFHTGTASSISERLRITYTGNCGIGTTSPSSKLEVVGGASHGTGFTQTRSGHPSFSLLNGGTNSVYLGIAPDGGSYNTFMQVVEDGTDINYLRFNTGAGTERMRVTSGGEVYIAGTSDQGAYNLQVNGTGVWGAGAYVNGSDKRLKEDIKPLENAIDVINKIKPVTYKYKESYSKDKSTQTGFIAQELLEALEGQIYKDGIVKTDSEYMNVAYQNIIALLVKSTQELKAEIETLKAQINN